MEGVRGERREMFFFVVSADGRLFQVSFAAFPDFHGTGCGSQECCVDLERERLYIFTMQMVPWWSISPPWGTALSGEALNVLEGTTALTDTS